ncbi:5'-methylthioadenosine/S-adenosylhomocysteine nucleosidase [Sphingomonas aracearum]|uniref:5'-methylthioadenosine/S-adenosylhomocysteine nucleosidase n=1 Tax=Sphingomonas aracearum TaxID=2283317 RepID=A0A369VWG8_9SPHN|nr:5'-methylthioadenosine/S-adenosylhomocysteine nucleosidase [Sphingomonas aracearum]RDE06736.1 5'-methylthioadenosine/S-adenosylhomocysteine nucleosidase [Sphingomonas aracearum]
MKTPPPLELRHGRRLLFVMACEPEYGPALRSRIRPVMTGVGPIEAALTMASALQRLEDAGTLPDLVVSLGSAGSRRCTLGEVYQVSTVCWRDMDASRLGFERGVTPLADHPVCIALETPLPGVPTATLSTGANVIGGEDYAAIEADMVDMETFAVLRACQRFGVPLMGLRGISDGPGELAGMAGWEALLHHLDERLAEAVDQL